MGGGEFKFIRLCAINVMSATGTRAQVARNRPIGARINIRPAAGFAR